VSQLAFVSLAVRRLEPDPTQTLATSLQRCSRNLSSRSCELRLLGPHHNHNHNPITHSTNSEPSTHLGTPRSLSLSHTHSNVSTPRSECSYFLLLLATQTADWCVDAAHVTVSTPACDLGHPLSCTQLPTAPYCLASPHNVTFPSIPPIHTLNTYR